MNITWSKVDDQRYVLVLGKALLVAVVYEQLTPVGWKVQVGRRALKDKFAKLEDAQKIALAFADKVAASILSDLEELRAAGALPPKS
ncbi:hypothetical protein JCM15519_12700 [Fundidesulfovibrio butyratiphilus]